MEVRVCRILKGPITAQCTVPTFIEKVLAYFKLPAPKVNETTKTGEGHSIASPERCNQFCDLTHGCKFWTWYKRHCDK